jgi:predicted extracellular nuclease
MKPTFLLAPMALALVGASGASAQSVFINEIHYDNSGTDTGEFVEVAGTAGTDLSGWSLVFYNGSGGSSYRTSTLSDVLADDTGTGFGFSVVNLPTNGIQNGSPDGIALVNGSTVVEFISYEGSFTAVDGPANGMTSTDIGVSETSGTDAGFSLQLTGTGFTAGDFIWAAPTVETKGAANNGQTFSAPVDTPPTVSSTDPADRESRVPEDASIEIVFSEPVSVSSIGFDMDCTSGENVAFDAMPSVDNAIWTLDPDADLTPGDRCVVTIFADEVTDQDGDLDNLEADVSFIFEVAREVAEETSCAAFINEFHYDNSGTDTGEFVEVAGTAGTDLSGWSLVFYNGSGGSSYRTSTLSDVLADDTGTGFGFSVVNLPTNGIQNGSPDGIALVNGSTVVEFISYEGSFTAVDGPANGMTSTDIGVSETSGTDAGFSLQLTGTGFTAGDFIWAAPAAQTKGAANISQTFVAPTFPCSSGEPEVLVLTIPEIQGLGFASPYAGSTVATTGVVVGDFQGVPGSEEFHPEQLSGFFIQDPTGDEGLGSELTSEGLFVFCGAVCAANPVAVGDVVTVEGVIEEDFGLTRINVSGGSVLVDGSADLPSPALIDLPLGPTDDLEPFEGMLVSYVDQLFVSEYFQLGRFGEVVLFEGGRPFQFTHLNAPDAAGNSAYQEELAKRKVILDDDANGGNQALEKDLNVFYPRPGLSIYNYFRGGDTITDLTGVLDYAFGAYRVRPVLEAFDYSFAPYNPRPVNPDNVGGTMRVASANVLNFFDTIDVTLSTRSGDCGPSGSLDCRGADSALELERQTAKLVAALCEMDADIVGLSEIENDFKGTDSLDSFVGALNDAGCGPYTYVNAGPLGTDAIKVALIYKSDTVTPVAGQTHIVDNSVDPNYIDTKNRPTLIQVFEEQATSQRVIVAAHHLKSKGSSCNDVGDPDLNDGQANCSQTRAKAAGIIADYIAASVIPTADTDRVMLIGDLNAYKREDAITTLTGRGYVDLIEAFNGNEAYSYVFDGQRGYLDHALGLNMDAYVTGVTEWHINADEINLLDYNDDVLDEPGEPFFRAFEEEPDNLPLYEADPFRSSDHDPVIVGLDLRKVAVDKDACKKGGWRGLKRADGTGFKNQGDCIQYVNMGK